MTSSTCTDCDWKCLTSHSQSRKYHRSIDQPGTHLPNHRSSRCFCPETLTSHAPFFFKQSQIDATSPDGEKPDPLIGDIRFDNVTFTYPARPDHPVRHHRSISLPPASFHADLAQLDTDCSFGQNRGLRRSIRMRQ